MHDNGAGRLEAIWLKRVRGGPMDPVERAELRAGAGIVGNANQGGRRQVTIIDSATWTDLLAEVGGGADPSARRANFLVSGLALADSRDRVLQVGGCRIRIRGETRPCEQMDDALPGLRAAMSRPWGGGAFGEILDDGWVAVGDVVRWLE